MAKNAGCKTVNGLCLPGNKASEIWNEITAPNVHRSIISVLKMNKPLDCLLLRKGIYEKEDGFH